MVEIKQKECIKSCKENGTGTNRKSNSGRMETIGTI